MKDGVEHESVAIAEKSWMTLSCGVRSSTAAGYIHLLHSKMQAVTSTI